MKNKKGFTLVELLIVIALIAGITALAVSGIKTINKNQKEIQWESVKNEILTAGKQFFNSNKYYLEQLNKENIGYVSIKTLVEKGYLGKVVNPVTNTRIDGCSIVTIDNENNYEFYEFSKLTEELKDKLNLNSSSCLMSKPRYIVKGDLTPEKEQSSSQTPSSKPIPACPTFRYKYEGNNPYKLVEISVTPASGTAKWKWYTNTANTNNYQYWGEKTGVEKVELKGNGRRKGKVVVYNSVGQTRECYTNEFILDNTAPKVEISIYKRKNDKDKTGQKGYNNYEEKGLIDKKEWQNTGTNHNNYIFGYGWFNNDTARYGFSIYMRSNEELQKVESYWNKAGLNKSNGVDDPNRYYWNNNRYKEGDSEVLNKSKNFYDNYWFTYISEEGERRIRFFFYDKANNVTEVEVSLNMDRTAPTGEISTPYNARCSNASNNNGYSRGTTISGRCTDTLSGPISSTISKRLNTLGSSINTTDTCVDNAGNQAPARNYKVCVYSADSSCGAYCSSRNKSCPKGGILNGDRCNTHTGPYTTQSNCRKNCSSGTCSEPGTGYGATKAKPWVCMTSYPATEGSCKTYSNNSCWHY